jgi:hypothetical protein
MGLGDINRVVTPWSSKSNSDSYDPLYWFHSPDYKTPDADRLHAQLGAALGADWERTQQQLLPAIADAQKRMTDRSLITETEKNLGIAGDMSEALQTRSMARYGATLTPEQIAAQKRQDAVQGAAIGAGAINNARLTQGDISTQAAADLSDIGNTLYNRGLDDLLNASGIASSREVTNNQQRDAQISRNQNTAATAASIAIML